MDYYIDKFDKVVDLMRETGSYTSAALSGTLYTITSNVPSSLAVKDYIRLDGTTEVRVTSITNSKVFVIDSLGQAIPAAGEWKAMAPYFDYGTKKTINNKLVAKSGGEFSYQKYPLIALRDPSVINSSGGVESIDVNILITTFTSKKYNPQQRIAYTFKPILYPLMTRFLNMLKQSGEFISFTPDYSRIDRLFYGTKAGDEQNIANVFDDPLDAVELRSLRLNYLLENCT